MAVVNFVSSRRSSASSLAFNERSSAPALHGSELLVTSLVRLLATGGERDDAGARIVRVLIPEDEA